MSVASGASPANRRHREIELHVSPNVSNVPCSFCRNDTYYYVKHHSMLLNDILADSPPSEGDATGRRPTLGTASFSMVSILVADDRT
jgi:hypothetical protein